MEGIRLWEGVCEEGFALLFASSFSFDFCSFTAALKSFKVNASLVNLACPRHPSTGNCCVAFVVGGPDWGENNAVLKLVFCWAKNSLVISMEGRTVWKYLSISESFSSSTGSSSSCDMVR